MAEILLISDLHLADKTGTDNFTSEERLIKLILEKQPQKIYSVGDFLELWQVRWKVIRRIYGRLLDFLKNYDVQCILGNHDWEIQRIKDFPFPFVPTLMETIGNRKFFFIHGQQFDLFFNNPKTWRFIKPFVRLYGFIEKIFKKQPATAKTFEYKQRVEGHFVSDDIYRKAAVKILKNTDVDVVVMGHTHKSVKEVYLINGRKKEYWNCGAWVDGKEDYFFL